ncbi:hypothetical protein [Streptomyces yangpuensis]|uniref:hypothetical protein n=1 Tax=Streptomyces yangpuensis TaxID=1648182 RepID=UPI0035D5E506
MTAHALLQRQDRAGLALVASALAVADPYHAGWIHTALRDAFTVYAAGRGAAMRICEELARTPRSVPPGERAGSTRAWPASTASFTPPSAPGPVIRAPPAAAHRAPGDA